MEAVKIPARPMAATEEEKRKGATDGPVRFDAGIKHGLDDGRRESVFILPAAAIESFNPEPGTAANSGGPTALVDPTGRLAVGSGLNNL